MEFEKDTAFVSGRLKSVGYAVKGAIRLLRSEHSVMVQFMIGLATIAAGFYFEITATEWMLQTLAIGLVLAVEGLNTAIEKLCDFLHPGFHEKIGLVKDISAGAVLFAAVSALAIGLIIYVPRLFNV